MLPLGCHVHLQPYQVGVTAGLAGIPSRLPDSDLSFLDMSKLSIKDPSHDPGPRLRTAGAVRLQVTTSFEGACALLSKPKALLSI